MKRFNIYKALLLGTIILLSAACNKNLLNQPPLNQVTDATYWTQDTDAVMFVTNLYTVLPQAGAYGSGGGFDYYEGMSDNGVSRDGTTDRFATSTQDATVSGGEWDYAPIKQAYEYFENVGRIPNMDTALRSRLNGEVYFVLAYRYFIMATLYQDVPLVTQNYTDPNQSNIPVTPHVVVIDSVVQWLNDAVAVLPLSYSGADLGRITKGAALALLCRVYLYQGMWAQAAAAAQSVMNLNLYSLYPDYYSFFQKDGDFSSEDILHYGYAIDNQNNCAAILGSKDLERGQNVMDPSSDLVNDYESANGYYPYTGDPAYSPTAPFNNRDPRLAASILYPGEIFQYAEFSYLNQYDPFNLNSGDRIGAQQGTLSGYSWCKNVDHYSYTQNGVNGWKSFRYGEVLLNYAEAENEVSGPSPAILAALDNIRTRAHMPSTAQFFATNGWTMSQTTLRTFIRHERRIELAGEGLRYFDILRWKTGEQVLDGPIYTIDASAGIAAIDTAGGNPNTYPKTLVETRYFNSNKFYVWPIPQSAIDASNGVLVQNALWQ